MRVRRALPLVLALAGLAASAGRAALAAEPVPSDVFLRRAAFQWRTGDVRGAARTLESIDFTAVASDSARVLPRAAFLRVAAAIRLGDPDALARALAGAAFLPADSPESRWTSLLAGGASGTFPELPAIVARWMEALAAEAAGLPADDLWRDLARLDAKTPLERELAGAAALRAATAALARGDDPTSLLERTPSASAAARRALRMRALLAREHGDSSAAKNFLAEASSGRIETAEDREIALATASLALDEGRWDDALRDLDAVDAAWRAEERAIDRFAEAGLDASLDWGAWLQERPGSRALVHDRASAAAPFDRAVDAALRGAAGGLVPPPAPEFSLGVPSSALGFALPAPDSALAAEARALHGARASALGRLASSEDALLEARAEIARRLAYLERGAEGSGREADALRALAARIDALIASTDDAVAQLVRLRDEELRRIAERTALFLRRCEENGVIARAIRHWRAEGPNRTRPDVLAPGVPAPLEILEQEIVLADTLRTWIEGFSAIMPNLVTRSHAEIWEPRAREGPLALARTAKERIAWNARVRASIDSSIAYAAAPERVAPFEDAIRGARAEFARLEDAERTARAALLARAGEEARRVHSAEGEGIAYLHSIASYELAVAEAMERLRLGAGGTPDASPAVRGPIARERLARFLEGYPASGGRAEIRYRLADLEILRAREDFQAKMASFLGTSSGAPQGTTALAPFVDYDPALSLYREILDENPEFAHRDAVLFQAGMILSDQGDPAARGLLGELVDSFADSPFRGRAALRLGDDDFERRELAPAAAHFEIAASSGDPEVGSIALYKLGWVHFNRDAHQAAAESFLRLLDLYEADPAALELTDLRREGEESLIRALAQADGPRSFASLFGEDPRRSFDARVLGGLAGSLVGFNQYDDAAACDSLLLERHPRSPEALDTARHLIATFEEASRPDRAMDARIALAARFRRDSEWGRAAASDSLRAAGDAFARGSLEVVALDRHALARESKDEAAWTEALALHERLLEGWPNDAAHARTAFLAGEAAAALGRHETAIARFEQAAADTGALATDASWQLVAVRDAAYSSAESAKSGGAPDRAGELLKEIDRFAAAHPGDARVVEALWRKGDVARRHGRLVESAEAYAAFLSHAPRDPRAPDAAHAAARALFDAERFADAGDAFERAVTVARAAGVDSLAAELEPLVPMCHFKQAEAVEADASRFAEAGRLFDVVARRWPRFEYADRALYRAGLDHARAGSADDAVRSWNTLLESHRGSELARDAHLQIASTWKNASRPEAAARAYERFSEAYPDDPEAQDALLEAADLLAAAKDEPAADALRTRYLERFPDDVDTAFAILGVRAAKELRTVGPDLPVAALTKRPESSLARYLALSRAHPDLASPALLAEASYLQGEDARRAYESARLTQPIGASIAAKKKLLESVLGEYRQCVELGAEPWSIAGAYRIGESLVKFGDALRESTRPADLSGDDLAAYEEVLERQSWEFFDRGEETWTQLLKSAKPSSDEAKTWLTKTRGELWPRIAKRFVHRPEMVHPLLAADPPKSTAPTRLTQGEGAADGSGS